MPMAMTRLAIAAATRSVACTGVGRRAHFQRNNGTSLNFTKNRLRKVKVIRKYNSTRINVANRIQKVLENSVERRKSWNAERKIEKKPY